MDELDELDDDDDVRPVKVSVSPVWNPTVVPVEADVALVELPAVALVELPVLSLVELPSMPVTVTGEADVVEDVDVELVAVLESLDPVDPIGTTH